VPLEAVVGTAGSCAPQGASLGTLRYNGLRAPHPLTLRFISVSVCIKRLLCILTAALLLCFLN